MQHYENAEVREQLEGGKAATRHYHLPRLSTKAVTAATVLGVIFAGIAFGWVRLFGLSTPGSFILASTLVLACGCLFYVFSARRPRDK